MSGDKRDIELRIWDEVDSGETERCVIHLERGQNLCEVLESMRALVWWEGGGGGGWWPDEVLGWGICGGRGNGGD